MILINEIIYFYFFFVGICIGSYINNISFRISDNLKENKSIYTSLKKSNTPSYSECPICNNKLKWWMNIPLFSWLFLNGECFYCKSKIPFIYFLSELFFGLIFVFLFYITNNIVIASILSILFSTFYLILLTFILFKLKK